jgi:predicted alpha/beta-hydrolase family hydrolase
MLISPPAVVARTANVKWQREAPRGGHFASLEVPDLFVQHVRDAFGQLWEA